MWGIFGLAEEMLASQEGLCSMKSVSQYNKFVLMLWRNKVSPCSGRLHTAHVMLK